MEGFILEINSQEVSKVVSSSVFPHIDLKGIDILFEKVTREIRGSNLKNTLCILYLISCKAVFFFNIFSSNLHFDALINRTLLDLPSHVSGSWRRYYLKSVRWCVHREEES